MDKLLIKRGSKQVLEQLDPLQVGELFLAKDEERLYIGGPKGNIPISTQKDVDEINEQLAQTAKEVTPLLFGAVGDGIADDRLALIETFKYAMDNGYTVNLLDNKTYLINSKDTTRSGADLVIFDITKKIKITGKSTIKIGAIGDYEAVFRLRAGASGSTFEKFTLDENTLENKTIDNDSPVAPHGSRRVSFYAWNSSPLEDITFDGITIKNCIGTWQITAKANNSRIQNVTVEYERDNGGVVPAYDRTCMYIAGSNWVVRDNKLLGYSLHTRTGIECHGSNITVDNNYINNFNSMLYIVNDPESGITNLDSINIVNNNFKCRKGLQFWFSISNCNLKNVNIVNNTFEVTGDTPVISTQQYPERNIVVDNIKIQSNTFIHHSATSPFMDIYSSSNTPITEPPLVYNNVIVQNNIFKGICKNIFEFVVQPAKRHVVKSLKILNNTFDITQLHQSLFRIVDVPYAFESIEVRNNTFNVEALDPNITNVEVFRGYMDIRDYGYGQVVFENNSYNIPPGAGLVFANVEGSKFLIVKEWFDMDISESLLGKYFYKGELRDSLNQLMLYDNGVVSKRVFYRSSMPKTGAFNKGDYVYNTSINVLGEAGSQYIVKGWIRVTDTAGGSHTLGIDWVEDRHLTGN